MKSSLVFLTCAVVLSTPVKDNLELFAQSHCTSIYGPAGGAYNQQNRVKAYERCQNAVSDVARKGLGAKKGYANIRSGTFAPYANLLNNDALTSIRAKKEQKVPV